MNTYYGVNDNLNMGYIYTTFYSESVIFVQSPCLMLDKCVFISCICRLKVSGPLKLQPIDLSGRSQIIKVDI